MEKIKVFEAFSGIGTQRMALKRLGIPHESVGVAEIDKHALKSYEAIHGDLPNYGDISQVNVGELPDMDLFTYSFPCQDISLAGSTKGLSEGSGTRSSLLWECRRVIEGKKPKYLLMENVKNLVGKKFKPDFDKWLDWLESQGYTNYWKVMNAKKYGVPQNRERVFVVSIFGEHTPFKFPEEVELQTKLRDLLEVEVEDKYFLGGTKDYFIKHSFEQEEKGNGFRFTPHIKENAEIGRAVTTRAGARIDDNFIVEGVSGEEPLLKFETKDKVLVREATKRGYAVAEVGDSINLEYPNSKTRRGRVGKEVSQTLTTSPQLYTFLGDLKIRKLTPLETWRLMGCLDGDLIKAKNAGVSEPQLYKQAGNAIVVDVLMALFSNLFTN